ncbi:GNAT family N-acetyltransferase [Bacillus toyonensis]|uniref:GNAT family N-acetyltransferase n=1 Tax=Bacillus toyonensis TaxID=155322 RepID=UPI000B4356EA|nr:GNAT family N-acetyltransferase [Bacillus toyonensis]OTX39442.1 GNAT family N-acetyltransferase [Bacillus thuringiensis serovar malayensis]OUB08145.1 GNAT family N-acetyltransferase [Bacillus thuringiensis serovar shandongiensis]MBX0355637.1 GNAT family N-acetyltransferase [Bacillus toyonensis]MDM5254186.1 GNAT family N-acetyltransferase [Bacillus toyonensis]MEC2394812.1 GNAT family N-acetyltransferase [Bacillus toyonensis]
MQKLYFTKYEATDFNQYFQLVSNEEVMAQITERAIPLDEAQNDFEKLLKRNEKHRLFGSYKVYDSITNEYIGLGHVTLSEENEKEAEIGYMILPGYWGKRYGSAIAKELMHIAKQTEVNVLKAIIDPNNIPSRKILLNFGFTSEKVCEIDGLPGEILSTYI